MPRFIDREIKAGFGKDPLKSKTPACPDWFEWDGQRFEVDEMQAEWSDLRRRGRMARNMSDAHAQRASLKGSWGVGRFYFRVQTKEGKVFDLYFDRAPRDAADRAGKWFLLCERNREELKGS